MQPLSQRIETFTDSVIRRVTRIANAGGNVVCRLFLDAPDRIRFVFCS